ncbi:MAG: hypothetical protein DRN04_01900 [Thermoprotei archaeon]|nr:MAG: hypothetical protein DRN04_01900 [Thermoprotei archaeon]
MKMNQLEDLRNQVRVFRVTSPPLYHFFGYYDKCPWSKNGKWLLCLETDFMDRPPLPQDKANICLINYAHDFSIKRLSQTSAWNWQQGCMLQWFPRKENTTIIYNDKEGGRFISVILNINSGERWSLPMPIYALSPDGKYALSLNFARLNDTRPGYGYCGVKDPWYSEKAPSKDGIYLIDIESRSYELIISLQELAQIAPQPSFEGAKHWVNHLLFNTRGNRFAFLHRWARSGGRFLTRMFTADRDGTDLHLLIDSGVVSHFDWRDDKYILAWCKIPGKGKHFFLIDESSGNAIPVGEDVLTTNGHCSYSPNRKWILTDTYPDSEGYRNLIIYNTETSEAFLIGRFYSMPKLKGEIRCDLHPRWSRDGKYVCIDSTHENSRQIYVLDLSSIV